jgi:hypothetical protein
MADDKERLNNSAAKAKRNLLFLSVVSWALACGWVRPRSGSTAISLGGVGLETTLQFVLWGLGALLAYNLISFWLHGPFGDSRKELRRNYLVSSTHFLSANADTLLHHITAAAGPNALPDGIAGIAQLDDWMHRQTNPDSWNKDDNTRRQGLDALWNALSRRTKSWLWWRAIRHTAGRRLLLEDWWDLWIPLLVGLSGIVAVLLACWRLT